MNKTQQYVRRLTSVPRSNGSIKNNTLRRGSVYSAAVQPYRQPPRRTILSVHFGMATGMCLRMVTSGVFLYTTWADRWPMYFSWPDGLAQALAIHLFNENTRETPNAHTQSDDNIV